MPPSPSISYSEGAGRRCLRPTVEAIGRYWICEEMRSWGCELTRYLPARGMSLFSRVSVWLEIAW